MSPFKKLADCGDQGNIAMLPSSFPTALAVFVTKNWLGRLLRPAYYQDAMLRHVILICTLLSLSCSWRNAAAAAAREKLCTDLFGAVETEIPQVRGVENVGYMRTNRSWRFYSERLIGLNLLRYDDMGRPFVKEPVEDHMRDTLVAQLRDKPEALKLIDARNWGEKKVIDLGCGGGEAVADLRKMDISAEGLDLVLGPQQKGKHYFHQADMSKTHFPADKYDVVISAYSVFHYTHTPEFNLKAAQEILRILKPGGVAMILDGNSGLKEFLNLAHFEILSRDPSQWTKS